MNKRDRQVVKDVIDNEGIDYGFNHYTDFEEVNDPEFHRLLRVYREAREALLDHCNIDE